MKCPKNNFRSGSAIVTVLGIGTLLIILIGSLFSFSSQRVQNVTQEGLIFKATTVAEAGLELALAEMTVDSSFVTHEISIDPLSGEKDPLVWGNDRIRTSSLEKKPGFNLQVANGSRGALCGSFGDGDFRVRVGEIPYKDDPRSKNLDESRAFLKIESMGRVANTIKCVSAIVQRRFPGREFLMYDGDFLSVIFGTIATNDVNKFSTGRLYGHNGVQIGRILSMFHKPQVPGTQQELVDLDLLSSGNGGVFVYSPTRMSFRKEKGQREISVLFPKNYDFPFTGTFSSPDAESHGEFPQEMLNAPPPPIPDELNKYVRDKNSNANSLPPNPVHFEVYKKEARSKGKYYSDADADVDYPMPTGWGRNTEKAKILDFGSNLRPGNVEIPENGIIFSEGNLVIKGNPPRDLKIFSKKNVLIAGDFNQKGVFDPNNPQTYKERYGFPQNYSKDALADVDYSPESLGLLQNDVEKSRPEERHHQPISVTAQERVVYDYRNPMDCFENELFPFLKFRLASYLSGETPEAGAIDAFHGVMKVPKDKAELDAMKVKISSFSPAKIEERVKKFLNEFPGSGSGEERNQLAARLAQIAAGSDPSNRSVKDQELERITKEVWGEYTKNYDANKLNESFGVYKLLGSLSNTVMAGPNQAEEDSPEDYLFFPEMTMDGMFVSCAKRNTRMFSGPDCGGQYDEIGNCGGGENSYPKEIGVQYLPYGRAIQRMYGSEVRLSNFEVHRVGQPVMYVPLLRHKIYDGGLPKFGLTSALSMGSNKNEIAAYVILKWQDKRVSSKEFESF